MNTNTFPMIEWTRGGIDADGISSEDFDTATLWMDEDDTDGPSIQIEANEDAAPYFAAEDKLLKKAGLTRDQVTIETNF